jgi:hypothetical protein
MNYMTLNPGQIAILDFHSRKVVFLNGPLTHDIETLEEFIDAQGFDLSNIQWMNG